MGPAHAPWNGPVLGDIGGPLIGSAAPAQNPPAGEVVPAYAQSIINGTDQAIIPAGCASCGGNLPLRTITGPISGGCGDCACADDSCGSWECKPGKTNQCYCDGCSDSFLGRLGGGFIQCICCPDSCYEGSWNYTANAAFFQDTVRPQTYTRLQWDSGHDLTTPERAEFFWSKPGVLGGKGPTNIETKVNYDTLSLYQEVSAGNISLFVNAPYVGVDPDNNPGHSNFGDISLGTKTLLLDCDLMQLSFQFRTYIPTGIASNGLGTGHTSLEPSLFGQHQADGRHLPASAGGLLDSARRRPGLRRRDLVVRRQLEPPVVQTRPVRA